MDNTQKAELCEAISEQIQERGLTHGDLLNYETGSVCLLGAGRLAQKANALGFNYIQASADRNTARVLGFDNPEQVWQRNDGFLRVDEAGCLVTTEAITEEEAIELAMSQAKHWRNQ